MTEIRELDTVALRYRRGQWPAGTTGAVLESLADNAALVELVGPDGRSLDMVTIPFDELDLVQHARSPTAPGPDRLAG